MGQNGSTQSDGRSERAPSGQQPIFKSRLPGTAKPVRVLAKALERSGAALHSASFSGASSAPDKPKDVRGASFSHPPGENTPKSTTPSVPTPPVSPDQDKVDPTASDNLATLSPPCFRRARPVEESKEAKVIKLQRLLSASNVDLHGLCNLCWSGSPPDYRAMIWRLLLGYTPSHVERREATMARLRKDYLDCVPEHFDSERSDYEDIQWKQIVVDLPRTNPSVALFSHPIIQECLHRILYIWTIRHPATGYVQGINDLATPFLYVFLSELLGPGVITGEGVETLDKASLDIVEADTFHCLTRMLDCVQDNYTFAQKGIQRKIFDLKRLIRRVDAPLHDHLEAQNIDFLQFSFRWMNCLLMRELNLTSTVRVWDAYVSEGVHFPTFHVYVCAAFLVHWSANLQALDFAGTMTFLQHLPTEDWKEDDVEMLLSQAYQWREMYNRSQAHLSQ